MLTTEDHLQCSIPLPVAVYVIKGAPPLHLPDISLQASVRSACGWVPGVQPIPNKAQGAPTRV